MIYKFSLSFRSTPTEVISAIETGMFAMQIPGSNPHSMPDPLLPYAINTLFKSPEWSNYRDDINNFNNAHCFIRLCLEKVGVERCAEQAAERAPFE